MGGKMSTETANSRMTLYRIAGVKTLEDAIKAKYLADDKYARSEVDLGDRDGLLIVGRTDEKEVGWAATLTAISGVTINEKNSVAAAVLLINDTLESRKASKGDLPADPEEGLHGDSTEREEPAAWALTFGMGFQLLEPTAIDSGFGQRIAIRSADPFGLNSVSKTTLDERPRIERSTIASGAPLRNFGFDDLGDLATRLVADGWIKGIAAEGKMVKLRGADSLNAPLPRDVNKLIECLDSIKEVLSTPPATKELAILEQLSVVKDEGLIGELDRALIESFSPNADAPLLSLAYPHELIDEFGAAQAHLITGNYARKPTDSLPTLAILLAAVRKAPESERLNKLERLSVLLYETESSESPISARIPLKKWLAFQTEVGGSRYCLHNGRWFLMDRNYAETVKRRTEEIFDRGPYFPTLPDWKLVRIPGDEKAEKKANSELEYNKILAKAVGGLVLDQKLIRSEFHRRGIEACDVLLKDGTFVHVKHVSSSAPASHLLAQALVSTEVTTYDKMAQKDLAKRIRLLGADPDEYQLKPTRLIIVLAKDESLVTADSLFTFTQVNLARQVAQLDSRGVEVHIAPIERRLP